MRKLNAYLQLFHAEWLVHVDIPARSALIRFESRHPRWFGYGWCRCEHCGAFRGLARRPARTAYFWDGTGRNLRSFTDSVVFALSLARKVGMTRKQFAQSSEAMEPAQRGACFTAFDQLADGSTRDVVFGWVKRFVLENSISGPRFNKHVLRILKTRWNERDVA
jgi:hypothetical protein